MKLVFLIGNTAVGKMTVGQALAQITELSLFHNHMMLEPVLEIFKTRNSVAVNRLRDVIFEEFAKSDGYGLIFTYMWAFDMQSDWAYIEHVKSIFAPYGTEVYYVELVAPQRVRLERNKTENRLASKPSKRNLAFSEQLLLGADEKHRCESYDGEIPFENYIKIDNSHLAPETVAERIKERFGL